MLVSGYGFFAQFRDVNILEMGARNRKARLFFDVQSC